MLQLHKFKKYNPYTEQNYLLFHFSFIIVHIIVILHRMATAVVELVELLKQSKYIIHLVSKS